MKFTPSYSFQALLNLYLVGTRRQVFSIVVNISRKVLVMGQLVPLPNFLVRSNTLFAHLNRQLALGMMWLSSAVSERYPNIVFFLKEMDVLNQDCSFLYFPSFCLGRRSWWRCSLFCESSFYRVWLR